MESLETCTMSYCSAQAVTVVGLATVVFLQCVCAGDDAHMHAYLIDHLTSILQCTVSFVQGHS